MSSPLRRMLHSIGPVFLAGLTFPDWIRLLRANHWEVDPVYLPRAVLVTLASATTSALKYVDDHTQSDTCDEEIWKRPVFILGLPRSGTTHLFQLIAASGAFCYPTRLDAFHPHTFRTLHRLGVPKLLSFIPAQKRIMDDVPTTWLSPEEDIAALDVLSGRGVSFKRSFHRTEGLIRQDTDSFSNSLRIFSRRLVQIYRKPPLFKSPTHTRCAEVILKLFPQARFVTIFRDPIDQVSSQLHTGRSGNLKWGALQRPSKQVRNNQFRANQNLLKFYFANRQLIPPGQLVEIQYEQLVADRDSTMQKVFDFLGLPAPPVAASSETWKKRNLAPPPPEMIDQILEAYHELYDRGLYPRPTREAPSHRSS